MNQVEPSSLDEQARQILQKNDKGTYTIPTAGLYPYQWNWDSAFAAWGFSTFDIDRAWVELETLMAGQWPNGMVPHIQFHSPDPGYFPGPDVWGTQGIGPSPSSGISQPPVAAIFARLIYEKNPLAGEPRIRALVPSLLRWHHWFMQWRQDNGVIFVTHPWEAGRDNTHDWDDAMANIDPVGVGDYTRRDTSHVDASMRPTKEDYDRYIWLVQRGRSAGWDEGLMAADRDFAVGDPTMTFILLRAQRDLLWLMTELQMTTGPLPLWIETLEAGAARLCDPKSGYFTALDLVSRKHTGHLTNASFLNWLGGVDSKAMQRALARMIETCRYPVPSYDAQACDFDGMRYWRGPTWAIMNALIGLGLKDMGLEDAAEKVRAGTQQMIMDHGFAEYFHPHTGAPAGGGSFTWTAAVWLAWASPSVKGA